MMIRHFTACLLSAFTGVGLAFAEPPAADAPLNHGQPLDYWTRQLKDDALAREEAAGVLANAGPAAEVALPALRELLNDPAATVRLQAAVAVWRLGRQGDAAAPVLAEALQRGDPSRRLLALRTLAEIGPGIKEVLPALRTALEDADALIRAAAADALAGIGAPAAALLKADLRDDDRQVRVTAAGTLLRIERHDPDAVAVLVEAAKGADAGLRRQAGQFLLRLRPRPKEGEAAYAALLKGDYEIATRLDAADALWALHKDAQEVLPVLTEGFQSGDAAVCERALWILARLGPEAKAVLPELTAKRLTDRFDTLGDVTGGIGPDAVPSLLQAYRSGNFGAETQAGQALARMGPAGAPALLRLLDNRDDPARVRVILWLGQIGPSAPGVVPALVRVAAEDQEPVRLTSLTALGGAGPVATEAVPLLLAALRDTEPDQRRAALRALRNFRLDPATALPALNRAVAVSEDSEALALAVELRWRLDGKAGPAVEALASGTVSPPAAEALRRIAARDADAAPALAKRLAGADPRSRFYLLLALDAAGPGAKAAIPELTDILKGDAAQNRPAAARLLARFGADPALVVPELTAGLTDPNAGGVEENLETLARFGKAAAPALPVVRGLWERPILEHRLAASECLVRIDPAAKGAALAVLRGMLATEPQWPRLSAAAALCRVDPSNPQAIAALRAMLSDPDANARHAAYLYCARAGPGAKALLALLKQVLADEGDFARLEAATAVWKMGGKPEPSVAALTNGLKDAAHAEVRRRAAVYLGDMGADATAAVPALRDALKDRSLGVRTAAVEALPKIDPEAAAAAGIP